MSSTSTKATSTGRIVAPATSSAAATLSVGSNLKIVGILLAIVSGLLIGSSFVFKKKGLIRSQAGGHAGEGVAYLKSTLWWLGMTMMITGELCNFAAYAFVEALVVTPMGALSVVICAILSSIFLKETLTFFGWLGCGLCIVGSVIIALNGPQESSVGQIRDFEKLFLAPGFLSFAGVLIAAALIIIFYFAPKYGKKNMLWYIMVCSMIGGISVSVTTGLGSAIVTTAMGKNQFNYWFTYFLMAFVVVTLVTEVYYLNVALALFNTAMVTPTYYVIFTFFSMVTSIVLFQGLKASASQIITIVMGFLVICCGITILQMSKIDPVDLGKRLDRRSTLLLHAARSNAGKHDEKDLSSFEDPGIDSIRGSFGPLGSMIRARSAHRMSMSSQATGTTRSRYRVHDPEAHYDGLRRHQLYDAPVPSFSAEENRDLGLSPGSGSPAPRTSTIKFDTEEVIHKYPKKGFGAQLATHERRDATYRTASPGQASMTTLTSVPEELQTSLDRLTLQQPRPTRATEGLGLFSISEPDSSGALRTAPANLFPSHSVGQESLQDPFDFAPMTSTGSTFASATTQPLPPRSRFSSTSGEDDEGGEDSNEGPRVTSSRHGRRGSKHGRAQSQEQVQRPGFERNIRGRTARSSRSPTGRCYPKGEDDKDEKISLVRRSSQDDQNGSNSPSEADDLLEQGGIRLVDTSSLNRF